MKVIKILVLSLILAMAVPTVVPTETCVVEAVSKTEKAIKKVAKQYAIGHNLKQYRYESAYELLEENGIKVTKKNVKIMEKWVKHYEKKYRWRYYPPVRRLCEVKR